MVTLLFAPFIGVLFMLVFIFIIKFCATIYPAFAIMIFPVFVLTNIIMILGGILRSRT